MNEEQNRKRCIGIDLGTSNTELAVLDQNGVETLSFTQNMTRSGLKRPSKRLASLVYFDRKGNVHYGDAFRRPTTEIQSYVGRVVMNTKRMLLDRPESKIYRIENDDGSVNLYSSEDIATLLLKRCYEEAVNQRGYQPNDPVMITVPCSYQMDQIHTTIRAAREAGFQIDPDRELITEPVAALVEYIKCQNEKYPIDDPRHIDLSRPQNILVYDLGGGTLDLSVIRIEMRDQEYHFRELANNHQDRNNTIGGADFDTRVAETITQKLLEEAAKNRNCTVEEVEADLGETDYVSKAGLEDAMQNYAYSLKDSIARNSIQIPQINFYETDDWSNSGETLEITLNGESAGGRASISYTEIVRDYLTPGDHRNILSPIRAVLDAVQLDGMKLPLQEVDKILITGGMCKFEPVREALMGYLKTLAENPDEPIRMTVLESTAGMEAVAIGAAYSHDMEIYNHYEYQTVRYYLDVNQGLPQELIARGNSTPIRLVNPSEAIFTIYSGDCEADPNLRRMYYFTKRFIPPLAGSAKVRFYLDEKENKESVLCGVISRNQVPDETVEFTPETQEKPQTDMSVANSRRKQKKRPSAYQGAASVDALEGTEKKLFWSNSNNEDTSNRRRFQDILHLMDIDGIRNGNLNHLNTPVYLRFDGLINEMGDYYWNRENNSHIPVLQYSLYALRQLPLADVPAPDYPQQRTMQDWEVGNYEDLVDGLDRFCKFAGELLIDPELSEETRKQLEEELIFCIVEWNWMDIFQYFISIAQCAASTSLAGALLRRLERQQKKLKHHLCESMELPSRDTQPRIAQIYWNAVEKGVQLSEEDLMYLTKLLAGDCCQINVQWLRSRQFQTLLQALDGERRTNIMRVLGIQAADAPHTVADLSQITRVSDFRQPEMRKYIRGMQDREQREKYWKKVNSFLSDPEQVWEMVRFLPAENGRYIDESVKQQLLELIPPEEYTVDWIQTLGCCRTREANARLERLWERTTLYQRVRYDYIQWNNLGRDEGKIRFLSLAEQWLQDDEALDNMLRDHSFDYLMALCFYNPPNRERNLILFSCILATVPDGWSTRTDVHGTYWKKVRDTLCMLWTRLKKLEQQKSRVALNSALYHLCILAARNNARDGDLEKMNLALRNFCQFFEEKRVACGMYQQDLVRLLLRIFAKAGLEGNKCPLNYKTQSKFVEFLRLYQEFNSLSADRGAYRLLMQVWYELTDDRGRNLLRQSAAYNGLTSRNPVNHALDYQRILDENYSSNSDN